MSETLWIIGRAAAPYGTSKYWAGFKEQRGMTARIYSWPIAPRATALLRRDVRNVAVVDAPNIVVLPVIFIARYESRLMPGRKRSLPIPDLLLDAIDKGMLTPIAIDAVRRTMAGQRSFNAGAAERLRQLFQRPEG